MLVASAPREGRASVCLGEGGHTQDSCASLSAKVVGRAEHCYLMHLDRACEAAQHVVSIC